VEKKKFIPDYQLTPPPHDAAIILAQKMQP
jgi:hypothetical protein